MKKVYLLSLLLVPIISTSLFSDDNEKSGSRKEIRVADLVALPTDDYHVDPYLRSAQALQELGKEKACALVRELAIKDPWPHTRTLALCRMLFQAKPKERFRRAAIGAASFPGGTEAEDWPSEPIEIVDGIPFLVTTDYLIGGFPEPPSDYLRYCVSKCDWIRVRYKPKSKEEKRKAVDKLLSYPKLKGKLGKDDRKFFENQIK
jgi:hypothetical protein